MATTGTLTKRSKKHMPSPWKKPNQLAKLLEIKPGEAREILRENPIALREARAAKRNGHDPKTILQDTNGGASPVEESERQAVSGAIGLNELKTVKALYDGYRKQDIESIADCIETVGGVKEFRKTKKLLDSLQYG